MGGQWSRQRTFLILVGALLSLLAGTFAVADETPQDRSRRPASGWAAKKNKDSDLHAAIEHKLKQILANQQAILQKADTVKQELGIIKIRATGSSRTGTVLATGVPCP